MARGDFVKVTYRTGVGTEAVEVVARIDGSVIEVSEIKSTTRFVEVNVLGRTDKVIEENWFAATDVVALVRGHKTKAQMTAKPRRLRVQATTLVEREAAQAAEQDPE